MICSIIGRFLDIIVDLVVVKLGLLIINLCVLSLSKSRMPLLLTSLLLLLSQIKLITEGRMFELLSLKVSVYFHSVFLYTCSYSLTPFCLVCGICRSCYINFYSLVRAFELEVMHWHDIWYQPAEPEFECIRACSSFNSIKLYWECYFSQFWLDIPILSDPDHNFQLV